jgi:hypothetical protein
LKSTSDDDTFSRLFKSVGRQSKYAGLGFIALSIVFLILAVSDQFVVFEVDSVVAFLVAIFLLFKDPHARVQAGVLDAILTSSDRAIAELVTSVGTRFTYVPTGDRIEDVVIVRSDSVDDAIPNGGASKAPRLMLTPPGRGLAQLYKRETGLSEVTMEALRASLSETMRENFGLARSVDIESREDGVKVTMHGASATCRCGQGPSATAAGNSVGCALASFLAVLVVAATKRSVSLEPCVHETNLDTRTVSMGWEPNVVVDK